MSVSILVVDDEADVAALFRQSFRHEVRSGTYALHFADSADTALERLRAGIVPPLIVILADINMPGMDGFGLLSEIRRRWPEPPVIMVTAYDDAERRQRASETGALNFLTKPVDFRYLKAQLEELTTAAG
jgi:CheY-like chemotaxis protein